MILNGWKWIFYLMIGHKRTSALLSALLLWIGLYLPLHWLYFSPAGGDAVMLAASATLGLALALLRRAWKGQSPRRDCLAPLLFFSALLLAALALSAVLFRLAPTEGPLYLVFYFFPQLLVIAFMLPGAVLYWGLTFYLSKA